MENNKNKFKITNLFKSEVTLLFVVFLVYVLFVNFRNPKFLSIGNISTLLIQSSITGVLTCGMFIAMITVGTDLSVAAGATFLGCMAAKLMMSAGWGVLPTILVVFLVGIGLEALMGFIIAKTGLSSFIVSIGFQAIYNSFTYLISNGSLIDMTYQLRFLNSNMIGEINNLIIVFWLVVLILALLLKYTKFGRRMYAVGCNSDAAFLSGINVVKLKVIVFAINGALMSLAALMSISRINAASPAMCSGYEVMAIAACVVGGVAMTGGKGKLQGAIIGIFFIGCIKNSLTMMGMNPYYADMIRGLIIIISVVASQTGIFKNLKDKLIKSK